MSALSLEFLSVLSIFEIIILYAISVLNGLMGTSPAQSLTGFNMMSMLLRLHINEYCRRLSCVYYFLIIQNQSHCWAIPLHTIFQTCFLPHRKKHWLKELGSYNICILFNSCVLPLCKKTLLSHLDWALYYSYITLLLLYFKHLEWYLYLVCV